MRSLLIGLLLLSTLLIGNIVAMVVSADYKGKIQSVFRSTSPSSPSSSNLSDIPPDEMTKLSTSLDRLAVGLDALTNTGVNLPTGLTQRATGSGTSIETSTPVEKITYQIPAALLTRLMPDIFLKEHKIEGVL